MLGSSWVAYAQQRPPLPDAQGVPTQFAQAHWDKENGLPQNSVNALVQTRAGYIWIGTHEGLARFDGQRFIPYRSAQYPALPNNEITALLETRDGLLWVGTHSGLTRFDGERFTVIPALRNTPIRALHETGDALWIATLDGLTHLSGGIVTSYGMAEGLPSARVLSVAADAQGRLWIGTLDGVAHFDGKRFHRAEDFPDAEVRALHLMPDGRFFAGTNEGLLELRNDRFEPFAPVGADVCTSVTTLASDRAGHLWIGTQDKGVCALMAGALYSLPPPHHLPDGQVSALTTDAEGGIWIGLQSRGLVRLHRAPLLTLGVSEGLSAPLVFSVTQTRDGSLWIGTEGGTLDRFKDGRFIHYGKAEGLTGAVMTALFEAQDGTFWASSTGGGLCSFTGTRFRCLTTQDGLLSNNILSIHETADGTLWIGTDRGLNTLIDGHIRDASALHESLVETVVPALTQAHTSLWVATAGGGVLRVQNGQARAYGRAEGLQGNDVLGFDVDKAGTLWAGIYEGGVCRFIPAQDRFRCYTTEDGLFDDRVLQLIWDDSNHLWLGTNLGFVRMAAGTFSAYDAGRIPRLSYEAVALTSQSGLRDPEANGGVQPAAWRGRDGTLYLATAGGVGIVQPGAIERYRNNRRPPVYIEGIRVNGSEWLVGENAVLSPQQRDLRFDFSVLSFQNPDSVRIRFRLDGHDNAWHALEGRDRSYTYANLGAGGYTFRVQAANADGLWNETGATYSFRVRPHIYETWWFFLLCGLALLGLGVALPRARVQALKNRQRQLEAVVDERTAELRAHEAELERVNSGLKAEVQRQLDVILIERHRYESELIDARDKAEESDRLKSTILDNMSHEFRTPISAILGFSEILSMEMPEGELREFVQHIDENAQRLLNTLNGVLDLSRIQSGGVALHLSPFDAVEVVQQMVAFSSSAATRKGIELSVCAPGPLPVKLDLTAVERVVGNLVSNAVKFTEQGGVYVSAHTEDDMLVLQVRDTGIGIGRSFMPHLYEPFKQESSGLTRSHEGSGLGLAIVHRYVSALGGTISVESEKDAGTTFTVYLPRAAQLHAAAVVA